MLESYKKQYENHTIQFVMVDLQGKVLDSDKTLFSLKKGQPIEKVHAFFQCVHSLKDVPQPEHIFNCVHLEIDGIDRTTDIRMIKKPEGILMVIYDLTQHYDEYQLVAQARNESVINSELIIIKNNELEERERFKNRFIQNFSHELRNPLTSILSITNLLDETPLTSPQKKMIDFLRDSTQNLKLMLEDILSISMISSGRLSLTEKTFSLHKLLNLLRFTYSAKAKAKNIVFEMQIEDTVPEFVEADRLRLYQILVNLLDNALKYTDTGVIALKVGLNQKRANRANVHFSVTDTGMGIAPKDQPLVFESFSQLDTDQKKEGVGLGLSIVRGLLELMGAEIKVRSELGKGSQFYFDLPMMVPLHSIEQEKKQTRRKTSLRPRRLDGKKLKVLLVEDDEHVQMVLFKIFMDEGCFYVDLANDGATVLEEIINNSYDLIIMDVVLPHASGDHLARLIREFPFKNIKNLPIIGVTAHASGDKAKKYREAGMDEVFSKPFEREALLKAVYKLV